MQKRVRMFVLANKVALPFEAAAVNRSLNPATRLHVCCTSAQAILCVSACFCECMHSGFVLAPAFSEVLVRARGRGQRERSLIKTDRSNTPAFPG